uniref:RT_RNaseH_2 domain-containing protein n=1 Tax=Strongyloides papillosus TaxID=174720 RepID=A0A0N5C9P3_STREA
YKFLGCWISAKGRKICTERYNHFKALKFPESLKDLETFQGLLSYFASYLVGLYKFKECFELEKVKVENNKIIPTTMQLECFAEIIKQLSSDNAVVHYSLKEKLLLACDSSENIMGATLFHVYSDNSRKPIISACKTLTSFEKKYDIASKEALAIVYFVQRFNQYLRCRKFEIECDNRAVTCIFQNNKNISKLAAKRIARYRLILSHYDFSIKLIRSKDNVLPDALSRLIDMDKVELFKEEEVLVSALSDSNYKNEFMLLKEELPSSVNISELIFISCYLKKRNNHFKALKFPETLKDLETFQGLLSYFASYLVGLYKFKECFELEKVKVKNNKIIPTTMQLEYFAEITKQLSSDNAVVHYSLKEKLLLACDSSENIMGATLFHVYSDNSRKPIISACKTLTSFEKKYDIASKEALAIVYFVQRFNQYLRCRKFEIECDNRAVT